jgi:TAP-like protein
MADLTIPSSHVWGDVAATGPIDDQAAAAYYATGGGHRSILGNPFTGHLWGGGVMKAWPQSPQIDQYRQLQPTNVDTLLISGDVDFATLAEFATKELLPTLRNGHQVLLRNLGHTTDIWNHQKPAANRLINTFFETGHVDQSGYTPREMSFHASPTHTLLAKEVLATLLGLAAITIAVLLWMPRRVRRRGSLGRKTSIATRTAFAPILGLGGWFIGLLIVPTLWPSVSCLNAPLAIAFISAPVAFSVYCAWVHRGWPRLIRYAGLCATVVGAAAGAWLGLHAVDGLYTPVMAIVAAVLGSNLALLLHDVAVGTPPVPSSHHSDRAPSSALVTART